MSRRFIGVLAAACVLGFVLGIGHLMRLRFEAGDVYPEYSSLRADPLGTMALCESLERLPGLTVRRDYSAANKLPDGQQTAYLHLATRTWNWERVPADVIAEIDTFLARGGRLAITFFPEMTRPTAFPFGGAPPGSTPPSQKSGPSKSGRKDKSAKTGDGGPREVRLKDKWGVEFGFVPLAPSDTDSFRPATVMNRTELPLPETLDWHSSMVFTNVQSPWRTIYARGKHPVVLERQTGPGSVVMATDSYFLSNEAMLKARHADLLAWLVGPVKHVVFDEAHLGIIEQQGVATLLRKYRLHGVAAGLMLLAALFVWKNASGFGPPVSDAVRQGHVAGREASAGFVNLLRRNLAPRDLLNTCFAEWTKSLARGGAHSIAQVDRAQAVIEAENALPPAQRNPVRAYQAICRALKAANVRGLKSGPEARAG